MVLRKKVKTRILHTKIWSDEWFCSISRSSSWIFLYILQCPENNISGIFELPDRVILFNTRTTQKELEIAKKELVGRVVFYKGWVKILHSNKYNNYVTNPKMEIALEKEMKLIPEEIIDFLNGYDTSMDTSIYTPNNHKSEIINNRGSLKEGEIKKWTESGQSTDGTTELQDFLQWWKDKNNFPKKTPETPQLITNFTYWRKTYSVREMQIALYLLFNGDKNNPNDKNKNYWKGQIDINILLRTRDKSQQPVDRIGKALNDFKGLYDPEELT